MTASKMSLAIVTCMMFLFTAGNIFGQQSKVVAEVDGIKVTDADLEQEESGKLLQARYQYYVAQSKALDELIDKKLLEKKAKSENLTAEQLIDREVTSKIQAPTEDQVKVYYEGLETDQPYEAVRGKILDKIRQVRTQRARLAYIQSLRAQTNIIVSLDPPSASVNLANANTLGNKNAAVMLVEFADYECPYCQKVAPDVSKLTTEFGDKLAVTFKDFPLPMHAHAEKAAEAANCAAQQGKFWEYHDTLFRTKQLDIDQLKQQAESLHLDSQQFNKCLDTGAEAAAVQKQREEGVTMGLSGTPSFFINGHFFSGALDYAALHDIITRQLSEQSHQVAMVTPGAQGNSPH
jgi:protein-disulfide isomerase